MFYDKILFLLSKYQCILLSAINISVHKLNHPGGVQSAFRHDIRLFSSKKYLHIDWASRGRELYGWKLDVWQIEAVISLNLLPRSDFESFLEIQPKKLIRNRRVNELSPFSGTTKEFIFNTFIYISWKLFESKSTFFYSIG